jgi:hypothetical protein
LRSHSALPLVFSYAGRETRAGYHVTEVKAGRFSALDCGANPEAWTETFIQVWDVVGEPGSQMMTVGKFLAIMGKVTRDVGLDPGSRLTFECGDDLGVIASTACRTISLEGRPCPCLPDAAPRLLQTTRPLGSSELASRSHPVMTETDALTEKANPREGLRLLLRSGEPASGKCC